MGGFRQRLYCALFTLLSSGSLCAQHHIVSVFASAGESSESGIRLDWTLGEAFIESYQNDPALAEGFQNLTVIPDQTSGVRYQSLDLEIYPNPVKTHIRTIHKELEAFRFEILNTLGLPVRQGLWSASTPLNVGDLEAGIYVLALTASSQRGNFLFLKM